MEGVSPLLPGTPDASLPYVSQCLRCDAANHLANKGQFYI